MLPLRRHSPTLGCLLICAALLMPAMAEAGRRPFFWVYDTEVLPSRMVEVEQWVWERRKLPSVGDDLTSLWWAPVIGLTDQLELALPIEWYWRQGAPTHLDTVGLDLRYRFASADPEEAGAWVPLLRLGVKRLLRRPDVWLFEGNGVLSWDPMERVHAAFDLGFLAETDGNLLVGTFAAGVSYLLTDELRVGAELFAEASIAPATRAFLMAGPNLGYTLGRFWFSGGVLIGLTPEAASIMPRIIWAVAF